MRGVTLPYLLGAVADTAYKVAQYGWQRFCHVRYSYEYVFAVCFSLTECLGIILLKILISRVARHNGKLRNDVDCAGCQEKVNRKGSSCHFTESVPCVRRGYRFTCRNGGMDALVTLYLHPNTSGGQTHHVCNSYRERAMPSTHRRGWQALIEPLIAAWSSGERRRYVYRFKKQFTLGAGDRSARPEVMGEAGIKEKCTVSR